MKNYTLITGILFTCITIFAQDPKWILQKSYDKCQEVQNGYYEMTRYMKFMTKPDTNDHSFYCTFRKLKSDSLFSSAFHYYTFEDDSVKFDVLYTGDDFVTASSKDSTATITAKSRWADKIKSFKHNYKFYTPLTNIKSYPMQHDSDFIDQKLSYTLLGEEKIDGFTTYHIQVNEIPEIDTAEMMQPIREEYHFWINTKDYIPVQFSTAYDMVMANDTMYQYEKQVLHKYRINTPEDETLLTLQSIPSSYKMKDYVPYKRPELLKKDSIAPDWELLSLADTKVSLNSLKGQLVLLDFFYKSCYPCMQALPALQDLHERYKDNGLRVIGIDPFDKKEDDIAAFLDKRGVTYTVLLDSKNVAQNYHVSGYPTMYLINKSGKILYVQDGYGKSVDSTLDKIIKEQLTD